MLIFGFFLFPISEHSFTLKAAKKMFMARTNNPNLLVYKPADDDKLKDAREYFSKRTAAEIEKHRKIRVRGKDSLCLYFARAFSCCCNASIWS